MDEPIDGNLYQFTNLAGNMNLPAHQYLLATEPSVLFATGIFEQTKWILPKIEEILGGRPLDYVFVSHHEADECGGLTQIKKKYPKVTVLCSGLIANELPGFGYNGKVIVCDDRHGFTHDSLSLTFFSFPVESHNRDGLLVLENSTGLFYSSDVIVRNSRSKIEESSWEAEVEGIDTTVVPDPDRRSRLKTQLLSVRPRFIATGHGSCLRLQ